MGAAAALGRSSPRFLVPRTRAPVEAGGVSRRRRPPVATGAARRRRRRPGPRSRDGAARQAADDAGTDAPVNAFQRPTTAA